MQPKQLFVQKLGDLIQRHSYTRVIDLGSGTSWNLLPLLQRFPSLTYVGVEPDKDKVTRAKELFAKYYNVKFYNQLGYNLQNEKNNFDICLSLSVLEHVKQLEKFLKLSIDLTKPGGYVIHRYDLGHALYPSSFKERFQVWLGNNLPALLPENKFVCYLDEEKIKKLLEKHGARVIQTTYHQMPNHKVFLKLFEDDTGEKRELAQTILDWEYAVSKHLQNLKKGDREKLFPSICIVAQKL